MEESKYLYLDEVVKELYRIIESEQKRNKEINKSQDANAAELKAYIQEISAHQQITHTDVNVMKKEIENINKIVNKLRSEIHNGFAKKIMAEAYNNTVKQNNELMSRLTDIIKNQSEQNTETIQNQNQNNNSLLEKIFTKGGFAVAVITAIVAVIKLITG